MKTLLTSSALVLGLASAAQATPVQWSSADGGNDHWYEVIWAHATITWQDAKAAANSTLHNGIGGYLATITSAGEQTFLNGVNNAFSNSSPYHHGEYVAAWLGGTDEVSEGNWVWADTGEAFTYTNWADHEPNNDGNQDYIQGWWRGDKWDDAQTDFGLQKYVVEWDNPTVAPVPVPASLPLLIGGIGAMAMFARRRRKA